MKSLFYIFNNLMHEPDFVNHNDHFKRSTLYTLVTEIQRHISFSLEIINGDTFIRLLDLNLIRIVQKYFTETLFPSSVVSICRIYYYTKWFLILTCF